MVISCQLTDMRYPSESTTNTQLAHSMLTVADLSNPIGNAMSDPPGRPSMVLTDALIWTLTVQFKLLPTSSQA